MPRRLKALRPLLADPGMSAAGLLGSQWNSLATAAAPTCSGGHPGPSSYSTQQGWNTDGIVAYQHSSAGRRRSHAPGPGAAGRGRHAFAPGASSYSVSLPAAAQGAAAEAAPPRQLSAAAAEFIPCGMPGRGGFSGLWQISRDVHRPLQGRHEASCRASGSACRVHAAAAALADPVAESLSAREPVEGALVEYQKEKKHGMALLQRRDGKRNWIALDARGVTYSLRPSQIAYVLPGGAYDEEDLRAMSKAAEALCGDGKLMELAWQVVSDSDDMYDVEAMAELLFGGGAGVAETYAAHRLLSEDRTFFKQAGRLPAPRFQPRPAREVAQLQARAAAEAQAEQALAYWGAAARAARAAPAAERPAPDAWLQGPHAERLLAIEELALGRAEPRRLQLALTSLQAAGEVQGSGGAAELLGALRLWGPHDSIGLRQAGMTQEFPAQLQEAAAALIAHPPPDPDAGSRADLTHHNAIAIDDAATTEVDDAVSVERLPGGGLRYWVHVADPGRWLAPGSALDAEARRRGSTMYLPTGPIFMFPGALATGPFSLREGQPCCALSLGAELGPDGALLRHTVCASTVRPQARMTYNAVDAAAASSDPDALTPDLRALLEAAKLRQAWREAQGAATIFLDECSVRVGDSSAEDPEVALERLAVWESPSRAMVAEMMILAGQVAAAVGGAEGVPLPYRGQAAVVQPTQEELAAVPEGPCRAVLLRSRMVRGVCSTHAPMPHAGLGLPGYVQITSPIRRYTDLLAHWQLKAHLRGEAPPWGVASLGELVDEVAASVREHTLLEREITNYWLARYFRSAMARQPGRTWAALLMHWIRQETGVAQVQLEDEGLETVVRIDRPAKVGERLLLTCAFTDVRGGVYRLEEAVQPGMPSAAASEGIPYVGEEAAGEGDEEEGGAASTGLTEAGITVAGHV